MPNVKFGSEFAVTSWMSPRFLKLIANFSVGNLRFLKAAGALVLSFQLISKTYGFNLLMNLIKTVFVKHYYILTFLEQRTLVF